MMMYSLSYILFNNMAAIFHPSDKRTKKRTRSLGKSICLIEIFFHQFCFGSVSFHISMIFVDGTTENVSEYIYVCAIWCELRCKFLWLVPYLFVCHFGYVVYTSVMPAKFKLVNVYRIIFLLACIVICLSTLLYNVLMLSAFGATSTTTTWSPLGRTSVRDDVHIYDDCI